MLNRAKLNNIQNLFNRLAGSYDLLNDLFSIRRHRYWKKKLIRCIDRDTKKILDLATGTADLAIIAKQTGRFDQIEAVDLSEKMLTYAAKKLKKLKVNGIVLKQANVEKLPYLDNTFDVITIGFGLRNFNNHEQSLKEIARVVKPGGKILILEFLMPVNKIVKFFYKLYFKLIVIPLGEFLSNREGAYHYLYRSIKDFYSEEEFVKLLENSNFQTEKITYFGLKSVLLYKGCKR